MDFSFDYYIKNASLNANLKFFPLQLLQKRILLFPQPLKAAPKLKNQRNNRYDH